MNNYVYQPKGVCSTEYRFQIEENIIKDVEIMNGCQGNLLGIRALILDKPVAEIINTLEGIRCGLKPTSCPDQIAQGLKAYLVAQGV
jgi:uncharacterized protein TIGR03905